MHHRQYSVIETTKDGYWIAVKREGLVSNWLHEQRVGMEVPISAPAGAFVLQEMDRPLTLIAGGIGITPLLPMAKAALEQGRPVTLLHAVETESSRPLQEKLDVLERMGLRLLRHTDDSAGRLQARHLQALMVDGHDVYTCGSDRDDGTSRSNDSSRTLRMFWTDPDPPSYVKKGFKQA